MLPCSAQCLVWETVCDSNSLPNKTLDTEATQLIRPLQNSSTQIGIHEKKAQTVYNKISPPTEVNTYTIKTISDAVAVNSYPLTNTV